MMRSTKRGMTLVWMVKFLISAVAMLAIMLIMLQSYLSAQLNPNMDISALDAGLVMNHLLYTSDGLAAIDENTGRTLPGIIDSNKLKNPQLDFLASESAAKITIGNLAPVFYHKNKYDSKAPYAGSKGEGAVKVTTFNTIALLRENGKDTPTAVKVEVLQ